MPVSEVEEPAVKVVGGRRRKAVQSGGIFRAALAGLANPDAPLAPHRAELHKPTQGLICVAYGGFVSSAGLGLSLVPAAGSSGITPSLCGL